MGTEYYERLGVASDASTDEIAAAYRKRLKETHPDVSDASDAGERTKRLIEAKEVLTDETERARYDRLGHDRYVSIEEGRTPDPAESTTDDDRSPGAERTSRANAGTDTSGQESTDSATAGSGDSKTGQRRTGVRGTRGSGGVDWGTHTARQGRSRHAGGIDWEEWAETDWEAVSEAVWQEVAGDGTGGSQHTTADWGTGTPGDGAGADTKATGTPGRNGGDRTTRGGGDTSWSAREHAGRETDRGAQTAAAAASNNAGETGGAEAAGSVAGANGNGGTTGVAGKSATPGGVGSVAGTADRGDWSVGWYSGGDPSGTGHDDYSYGSSDTADSLWGTWSPGPDRNSRYRRSSFPPHRILSPIQTVVLFCLCFVTYPLLVTGTVFPFFNSPTRLVLAMFLVFVVAILIIVSQLGVVVFGGWTILFPVIFANYGVSVFAPAGLVTLAAVLVSLGLSMLSYLLIRPPAI